jgi:hypothetical protein
MVLTQTYDVCLAALKAQESTARSRLEQLLNAMFHLYANDIQIPKSMHQQYLDITTQLQVVHRKKIRAMAELALCWTEDDSKLDEKVDGFLGLIATLDGNSTSSHNKPTSNLKGESIKSMSPTISIQEQPSVAALSTPPLSLPDHKENVVCSICLDLIEPSSTPSTSKSPVSTKLESFTLPCGHLFCISCIVEYTQHNVSSRKVPLTCPNVECKKVITPQTTLRYLQNKPELQSKYAGLFVEHSLGPENVVYCPNRVCSNPLVVEMDNEDSPFASCPSCSTDICVQCKVRFHHGYDCEEYQQLAASSKDDIPVLKLAQEKNWKRCPGCKTMVERKEGCNHIVCPCGTEFCYLCTTRYGKNMFGFNQVCFFRLHDMYYHLTLNRRVACSNVHMRYI